ncbi:hypothetical protein ANCCAN_09142 [Ancylostoma caninum]|uniref:Uncharacterized protein n=1 Tax=Ancylostoma caninum TaxID=29170 RepID=A0A368GP78_ANCCA|nr:hypothetical protein ANCCAN_09142 [Ancylostoma caninum]
MPTDYTAVDVDPNTPPPYMDPTNSIAKKKSMIMHSEKQISADFPLSFNKFQRNPWNTPGSDVSTVANSLNNQHVFSVVIWPAPRPHDHIRPDNTKFIGYILLIAVVIFLLFAACKYLP